MADSEKNGDFLSREEAERRDRALSVARSRELTEAFAHRRIPYKFRSDTDRERIEALNQLTESQNRFIGTYRDQQLALDHLRHVHDEARDREEMRRLENENRILELRLRRDRLQGQLHQETQDSGGVTGPDFRDEVEKVAQKARLDAAKRAAQAKAKIEARRDVVRERDAIKAEMLRDAGGIMTAEVTRELQNIDDAYQQILDDL